MLERILKLVKENQKINRQQNWYKGSEDYLEFLINELSETKNKMKENNIPYLEDEIGDIFWDLFNLVEGLIEEGKIDSLENVFKRCENKYFERVEGKKSGKLWEEIKKSQKEKLKKEFEEKYGDL